MSTDPFFSRRALLELAVTVLVVAFCLHWAVQLIAEVWPWLLGMAATVILGGAGLRVLRWRRDRW